MAAEGVRETDEERKDGNALMEEISGSCCSIAMTWQSRDFGRSCLDGLKVGQGVVCMSR